MIYPKPQSGVFAQDAPESEIKPFDAWIRGLGIAFDETNGFPDMESFNGLLQTLNSYIKHLEQNGLAEWTADLEYPIGAGVRVGSVWYRAKTQNTNKPPATSQNDWAVFLNASDLTYSDPLQISANGQVTVKDATTTQKGVTRFASNTEVANKTNVSASINPSNAATIAQTTDLGVGQSWQNVTASRAKNTTYTNNTGKPIQVFIQFDPAGNFSEFHINNTVIKAPDLVAYSFNFIIPNGSTYKLTDWGLVIPIVWMELR